MEPLIQTRVIPVKDSSQVMAARRTVGELAQSLGLGEQRVSACKVVASELANNLLQHAGGGELYVQYIAHAGALEMAAVDHGPGMVNVERCLADGFSTGSTPGLGLGAVRRFAVRFGAYSMPGRTTVIAARMTEQRAAPEYSAVCTAMGGETLSGDGWSVSDDGATFLVIDGLGHGVLAQTAARAGVDAFCKHQTSAPEVILERMHGAMRATRGAAAAIARVDSAGRRVQFAGIGNIACGLMGGVKGQSFVSHNGTLGHQVRRIQAFEYGYGSGELLFMQSDGLTTHTRKGIPTGLLRQSPSVIAPFLYSEQVRGRDDATLLVNRLG